MGLPKLRNIKIFRKFGISFEKTESVTVRRRGTSAVVWSEQRGKELDHSSTSAATVQQLTNENREAMDDSETFVSEESSVVPDEKRE